MVYSSKRNSEVKNDNPQKQRLLRLKGGEGRMGDVVIKRIPVKQSQSQTQYIFGLVMLGIEFLKLIMITLK